jgi:ferredoxin
MKKPFTQKTIPIQSVALGAMADGVFSLSGGPGKIYPRSVVGYLREQICKHMCPQVCPTGIDIRNGLQSECIACAACIDVCDEVLFKMNYPTGLIRYASGTGIADNLSPGQMLKRVWRPRVWALRRGIGALTNRLTMAADTAQAYRGKASPIRFRVKTADRGHTVAVEEKSTFVIPR